MIDLLVWKATKEDEEILNSLMLYVQGKLVGPVIYKIIDLSSQEDTGKGIVTIAFGPQASRFLSGFKESDVYIFPKPELLTNNGVNTKRRMEAVVKLDKIAARIHRAQTEKPTKIHLETEEKVTIGKEACDINVSEEEAEYLKKLRDLLGGSKIVVTKGDIRIEVE